MQTHNDGLADLLHHVGVTEQSMVAAAADGGEEANGTHRQVVLHASAFKFELYALQMCT